MRELGDGWYGYGAGVIASIGSGDPRVAHTYVSGTDVRNPDDPMLFKCATQRGDLLYATTETEVIVYRLPDFEILHHLSHRWFNDVHHVLPTSAGSLLVASSGAESVLELDLDGELLGVYPAGDEPSPAIDEDRDLRFGVNLKPHAIHPNHLFLVGDEPWVTRFERRDAVSLVDRRRRIAIERQRVHDGHVVDGQVWFTTVDGAVVVGDPETGHIVDTFDLNESRQAVIPGWCRGLLVGQDHFWVGFSRIRQTAVRSRLSWLRTGLTTSLPTRVERWDRSTRTMDESIDLEPLGVNAVFSILKGVSCCT